MKAKNYYNEIRSKWANEYPSTSNMNEVWDFYKECGYQDPQKTLSSILAHVEWNKGRVLDLGCDTGFMLNFIHSQYPQLNGFGLDINGEALAKAKENFPQFNFQEYDGTTLPFEDKHFDMVFVSAVVKHIRYEDRAHFYSEIKRTSDTVFFIEADSKEQKEVPHRGWTFYNSHFEKEFSEEFTPVKVVYEAGDILGLYKCDSPT